MNASRPHSSFARTTHTPLTHSLTHNPQPNPPKLNPQVYLFPAKKNKQSSHGAPSSGGPSNGGAMFDGQSVEVSNAPTAIPAPISSPR